MCTDKAAEKDALHMALQLHRMNLTDLSSASVISRHLLVMIQRQCGTNKTGPPVHICVCCGESAPSPSSIQQEYQQTQTAVCAAAVGQEMIQSFDGTRDTVNEY